MRILLFGSEGQVGRELCRALRIFGEVRSLNRFDCDLTDEFSIIKSLRSYCPDVIVNAAAYTAVERAERDIQMAHAVNARAPELIAKEAKLLGSLVIHFSTDYVFDGANHLPYVETDQPNPINVYGRTKLAGELAIQNSCDRYIILRTSWVLATVGGNFAKKVLKMAATQEQLKIVSDQFGVPTSASLIADITGHLIFQYSQKSGFDFNYGLYHLVAGGMTNWHEYASYVLKKAISIGFDSKASPNDIIPINTNAYHGEVMRPRNTVLDATKLQRTFNVFLPDWQDGVNYVLDQIVKGHL